MSPLSIMRGTNTDIAPIQNPVQNPSDGKWVFDKEKNRYVNPDDRRYSYWEKGGGEKRYGFDPAVADEDQVSKMKAAGYEPNSYLQVRTRTPYKTEADIKKNTPMPSSPDDIDFITNYKSASGDKNATSVPFEGEKHWNISRLLFQPHARSTEQTIHKGSEQSKEEYRNNILADSYKYFMLQNKGDREKAWKQAQDFTKKEIDPLFSGPVYDKLISQKEGSLPGGQFITSVVDDNFLSKQKAKRYAGRFNVDLHPSSSTSLDEKEQKDYAIDWLTKYKKMPLKDALLYYKKLEDQAKQEYIKTDPLMKKEYGERTLSPIFLKRIMTKQKNKPQEKAPEGL